MAGYADRSLVDKLGIKAGTRLLILAPPPGFARTLGTLPQGVVVAKQIGAMTAEKWQQWLRDFVGSGAAPAAATP